MHKVNDPSWSTNFFSTLDGWLNRDSTPIGLWVAALVLAGFGIGLFWGAYLRSRNQKPSVWLSWPRVNLILMPAIVIGVILAVLLITPIRQPRPKSVSVNHFSLQDLRDSILRRVHRRRHSFSFEILGGQKLLPPCPPPLPVERMKVAEASPPNPPPPSAPGKTKVTASPSPPDASPQTDPSLPDWVSKPEVVEPGGRRLIVVSTDFEGSREEAEAVALAKAAAVIGEELATHVPDARGWEPSPETVQSEAVRLFFVEPVHRKTVSSGVPFDVYRAYCQVELSPAVKRQMLAHWKDEVVSRRIIPLGGLAGWLTLTFGTLAAYFRLDSRTSGKYRRRLTLAAMSIVAAGGIAAVVLI